MTEPPLPPSLLTGQQKRQKRGSSHPPLATPAPLTPPSPPSCPSTEPLPVPASTLPRRVRYFISLLSLGPPFYQCQGALHPISSPLPFFRRLTFRAWSAPFLLFPAPLSPSPSPLSCTHAVRSFEAWSDSACLLPASHPPQRPTH